MKLWILCATLLSGHPTAEATPRLDYTHDLLIQLAVSNLDRSIAFYCEVLDFELEERVEDLRWARLKLGIADVTIGIGVRENGQGSGSLSLNLGVRDIEKARALLEARGVRFDGPTITVPGVVQLADFRDPDGNRLRLDADIDPQP